MLKPDSTAAGHWIDDARAPGSPGLFAVIIGISEYPFLRQGQSFHIDHDFELGQLGCAAITSRLLFEWLREEHEGAPPLAEVWLLLSPTEEELRLHPGLNDAAAPATFANIKGAVKAWRAATAKLSPQAGADSTSAFFYSGHGAELDIDAPLIFPADWPGNAGMNLDDLVDVEKLIKGMAGSPVCNQLWFLDACRTDLDKLGDNAPDPGRILPSPKASERNANRLVSLFFASSTGQSAWQPSDPAEAPTLYGRALLAGLRGGGGEALDAATVDDNGRSGVVVERLDAFLRDRVTQELDAAQQVVGASVTQLFQRPNANPVVTWISGALPVPPASGTATLIPAGATPPTIRSLLDDERTGHAHEERRPSRDIWKQQRSQKVQDLGPDADFGQAHQVFGHEWLTDRMATAQVHSLIDRPPEPLVLTNVSRADYDRTLVRGTIEHDGLGFLTADVFGAVVPAIFGARIDVEFEASHEGLHRVDVHLSLSSSGVAGEVAQLARDFQDDHSAKLDEMSDAARRSLERALAGKFRDPVSAVVAGGLLAREGQWVHLHDWLHNLDHRFSDFSDGAALHAHQLLHDHDDEGRLGIPYAERLPLAAERLLTLMSRGGPITTVAWSLARRATSTLTDAAEEGRWTPTAHDLPRLRELRGLLRPMRPTSTFCSARGLENKHIRWME